MFRSIIGGRGRSASGEPASLLALSEHLPAAPKRRGWWIPARTFAAAVLGAHMVTAASAQPQSPASQPKPATEATKAANRAVLDRLNSARRWARDFIPNIARFGRTR
jgi:hypothetical protein